VAESDHSGVDIFAKRAIEYALPDENSDTRLLAIRQEADASVAIIGGRCCWNPGFATGHGGVCPMRVGRFKVHFGSRISARRRILRPAPAALSRNAHHNRTRKTQPSNGIRCSVSAHDK